MRKLLLGLCFCVFFFGFVFPQGNALYKVHLEGADAVVFCFREGGAKTTGFFVSSDGWIATAGHGVDEDFPTALKVFVKLDRKVDSAVFEATKVLPPKEGYDLLLLKIDYKPKSYFKDIRNPFLFEETWIIGFRGTSGKSVSQSGFVCEDTRGSNYWRTTASPSFGNSGSPLISRGGELLGVIVMMSTPSGDGIFVPAVVLQEYMKENNIK